MTQTATEQIEAICRMTGLDHSTAQRVYLEVMVPAIEAGGGELSRLRAENEKLRRIQDEIAGLLHCKSPDKILHDLRNVLNELVLLKAVADQQ